MSYSQLFAQSIVAFLAITQTRAQDSPQCADISPDISQQLSYNATTTQNMTALNLEFLGDPADRDVIIQEDSSRTWQISANLQPVLGEQQSPNTTQTTLWLDTGSTDTTRLGQIMGMCHNVVPLQRGGNLTWSKEVLKRSLEDNGDCTTLVSEKCISALTQHYTTQANILRLDGTGCTKTNNTVPRECDGMVEPVSLNVPQFNSTLPLHLPWPSTITNLTDPLTCSGRNLSRSFGTLGPTQDFNVGVNFPLLDIMTFWPRVEQGRVSNGGAQYVKIMCLRPDEGVKWNQPIAGAQDVLDRYESINGDQRSGARGLGAGAGDAKTLVGWAVGVSIVIMFGL